MVKFIKISRNFTILSIIIVLLFSSTGTSIRIVEYDENIFNKITEQELILITGYGPFLDYETNPSEIIAEILDGEILRDAKLIGLKVPVYLSNFSQSLDIVINAIETYNPELVISIGLAPSSKKIRIEKIGLNIKYENEKFLKNEKHGPLLRLSNLPVYNTVKEIKKMGISARISFFAGTSLCNALLYNLTGYFDSNDLTIKSGFIHVPQLIEDNPDGMSLDTMVDAVRIAVNMTTN